MDQWEFDVFHSSHDELKQGVTEARWTRVLVSRREFPSFHEAAQTAALMGLARGEYVTKVMVCL